VSYAAMTKKAPIQTNTPRVSIVTPSFNQGQFIERTILSVLKQDYPNLQYIVMDARSTDRTKKILDAYRNEIDIIVQEKDEGQADAISKGFKLADGEIFAYLNSDDCLASKDVVSDVVNRFQEHKDADLIYGKRYYIDENGFITIAYPFRPFNKELLYKACYLPQECAFWKREIYERCGAYIDKSFRFAMDFDLWLRMLDAGAKFVAVDRLYGLFRWYEQQKSHAVWEEIGLPEIASLQMRYLGYAVRPKMMNAIFEEHFSGANRLHNQHAYEVYKSFWNVQTRLKKISLGAAPLDHWVFVKALTDGEVFA
jgi:glycosyltransferase involved in cell wall biosynthesis